MASSTSQAGVCVESELPWLEGRNLMSQALLPHSNCAPQTSHWLTHARQSQHSSSCTSIGVEAVLHFSSQDCASSAARELFTCQRELSPSASSPSAQPQQQQQEQPRQNLERQHKSSTTTHVLQCHHRADQTPDTNTSRRHSEGRDYNTSTPRPDLSP